MNRSASFVFACFVDFVFGVKANYAFKPIAEQALRSNQTVVPQRLNAALAFNAGPVGKVVLNFRRCARSISSRSTQVERSMRVAIKVVFGSLIMISFSSAVLAQEPTRSLKDPTELSESVNTVFSKNQCTQISENSTDGGGARRLAMTFRFRCEGEVAAVSALLKELQVVEGLFVEEVVKYPGVNPKTSNPSVDVRFNVAALTGVEG